MACYITGCNNQLKDNYRKALSYVLLWGEMGIKQY